MKLKKGKTAKAVRPSANKGKKHILVIAVLVVTALLIFWVMTLGRKAEETVDVVMYTQPIYKNEVITESMLKSYPMLVGEFEKYAVTNSNGTKQRRIVLWEERNKILNTFAAYPLKQETVAEISDFMTARIDNSDTVLYSFPGKDVVAMEAGDDDLKAFKTFLQPGDRINVTAIYSETENVTTLDSEGNEQIESVDTYREERLFNDVMVADMINSQGESILDIYASYNERSNYQQAQLDASEEFQDSVTPSSLLVALTPEELSRYYYFLGKRDVEFRVSLPQRTE